MDTTSPSRRMVELIETLVRQTRAGAIRWRQTDAPGEFLYRTRSGFVSVRGPVGNGGLAWQHLIKEHAVKAMDGAGDVVEAYVEEAGPEDSGYGPLRVLFRLILEQSDGSPLLDTIRHEAEAAGTPAA